MAQNVRFIKTTKEKYLKRDTYDPLALYFCEDTGEMFKGEVIISDGIRVIPTYDDLPDCPHAADGIVYYVEDTRNGYVMSPDRTKWLQTIYAPATDVSSIPAGEEYNVVTTVGAVRDIEKAIYTYIDEEISGIEVSDGVDSISFAGVEMTEVDGVFTIDKISAREALGISMPESEEAIIATEASVTAMSEELKAYVDAQITTGGTGTIDYGEI